MVAAPNGDLPENCKLDTNSTSHEGQEAFQIEVSPRGLKKEEEYDVVPIDPSNVEAAIIATTGATRTRWNCNLTPIRTCAAVALVCSIFNLFGDVCFVDFSFSTVNFDPLSENVDDATPRPGNLFDFAQDWPLHVAQASGWMYPIWAMVTIYPLYLGLEPPSGNTSDRGQNRNSILPCSLFAYGLCVLGGNLRSSFVFVTIIPQMLYDISLSDDEDVLDLHSTLSLAESKVLDCYHFGYVPGVLAVMIASVWIISVVIMRETKFPIWFTLCTPLVTIVCVNIVGFLMPWPWGLYFVGALGTWIILMMNIAASWVLWNVNTKIVLQQVTR